ncbi:hypothetical protein N7462_002140 [Penicillium macrosclerotiorum]|uniref:uncharacterized protein n=1 Tax=Penicillium macrosclerotiorum TaxID=303699 RepID=UPI0025465CCB|nr:uncharacterized protein N7462_002140 [Penicillium macrosclerotiorum]KAJ5692717.1 hypothetical protein N7462_002140 [Penicillium macrosclerotiorum]
MSSRTNNDPERVSLSQSRHSSGVQGISNMTSRSIPDDDLSSHDNSSLCSLPSAHGNPQDMKDWSLSAPDSLDQAMSSKDSPQVQMLSFSLSQQLMTPTVGPNDVMYTGVDFPAVSDLHDHNDLPRDFYSYVDLSAMDNDVCVQTSTPDDALSVAHSSHTEDGQLTWNAMMHDNQYPGTTLDQLSSSIFQAVPVSPPLTEASNDISVTSSCSHSAFPSFLAPDDTLLGDFTHSPIGNPGLNPAEPLFPSVSPLSEKDPNRTIRPTKQSRRGTVPTAGVKAESEFFHPLPVREPVRQRSKDTTDARNPREHPYYALGTQNDGKYHCPYTTREKPCNHPPTTQKCAYQQVLPVLPSFLLSRKIKTTNSRPYSKYLDSHLKPYRCKVAACMESQLRFSSNACLFRHEREAHGFHGHGDNPHLCHFEGCERSVPGFGFPRRWNLHDHMRRVHDYNSSERHSSPENSPPGVPTKKKDSSAGRKRRGVTGPTPAPTMKRTRSVHSQASPVKATQSTAQLGQRLQSAERSYYSCRTRLLEELGKITPQDASMHEKVNASLQELFTLGLNYRHIEASQAVSQMPNGRPA